MVNENDGKSNSDFDNLTPEQQARIDELGAAAKAEQNGSAQFEWSDAFQSKVMGALLTDKELASKALGAIQPGYFSAEVHGIITGVVKDYWTTYKTLPEKFVVEQELADLLKDREKAIQLQYLGQLETLYTFYVPGLDTIPYILDVISRFAKRQAILQAFHKVADICNDPSKVDQAAAEGFKRFQDIIKGNTEDGLMTCAQILASPDMEWLVDNHFPTDSTAIVYGKHGSMKSFYALELALSVASGRLFLGTHGVKAGAVVYIAGEGKAGYKKRLMAWFKHNNVAPLDKFFMLFRRFDFADAKEGVRLLGMVQQQSASPVLVIIDTVAQNLVGDENGKEMSQFLRTMADIRDGLDKACVLGIHHTGKDETRGPRGFSGIGGNVDVLFEIKKTDAGCSVRAEKIKDDEPTKKYLLQQVVVDLGLDSHGKPLKSLVLIPDQGPAPSVIALARLEEEQEEEDVLDCIPALAETDAGPKTAITRSKVQSKLEALNPSWTKSKIRIVFDRLEARTSNLRWKQFGSASTAPKYYWRDRTVASSKSGCTAAG